MCSLLVQRLFHTLQQDVLRQVNSDKYHLAATLFIRAPGGAEVAAHELVYALEDDLAIRALHKQHPFIAQHAGAIDVDDGAQKIFQPGRVKRTVGLENKAFDIVIMVMMVSMGMVMRRMIAVFAVYMVMIVVVL